MEKIEREKLMNALFEGKVIVTFDKLNGEERVMTCTLKNDLLPESFDSNKLREDVTSTPSEESSAIGQNQAVWDTTAGGWRSFRWDRLKGYEIA